MRKEKRELRLVALAVTGVLLFTILTGCSKSKTAGGDKALPVIKIAVIMEAAVRPAIVVATDTLGYYEEEGVKVEFINVDGASGLPAVETGKADIYPFSASSPLAAIARGGDLVIIAGTATEGSSLVANKNNLDVDFRNFKNFKGKKIGVYENDVVTYLFNELVKQNIPDYREGDIEWVGFDDGNIILSAIRNGSVDAGFLVTELVWQAEEGGLKEAFDLAEFLPEYICCRQTASSKAVKEKRDALKAVLRAQIRAENLYKNDTNRFVDAVTKFTGLERENVVRYIATEKNYYSTGLTKFRSPPSTNIMYNKLVKIWQVGIGLNLFSPVDGVKLKEHIDVSIYEDALKELISRYPNEPNYQTMYDIFKKDSSEYWG